MAPSMLQRFASFGFLLIVLFVGIGDLPAASPNGSWRGSWSSQTTGHRGPVRAKIRPIDNDTYRAVFVGRFAGVVPFVYPAKLERVPGCCDVYRSSQRLPLMGEYRMTASITKNRFRADYRAAKDRGTFDMSRRK